ncbi:MAG: UDP-N-acetylmuramoyl-L-alanine--D-glutamate ligase [Verrucomicrobiota bacterium]
MMQSGSKALVLGLGDSGEAAAALLQAEGMQVTAIDKADSPELRARAQRLQGLGARVLLGAAGVPDGAFDLCVVSPGVPVASPWIADMSRRAVPVVSELELGWSRRTGRTVAITGSNGKSTAVKWFAESLQQAGLKAAPVGNYGPAVSKVVRERRDLDWLVLEVSSFQLETVRDFRPEVGILLNINPNHLDRHGDLPTYARMKARLFSRTTEKDVCIVHESLAAAVRPLAGGRGVWRTFGSTAAADYRYEAGRITREGKVLADVGGTYFGNEILGVTAAAVVAGIEACGADAGCVVRAARAFEPLPHRTELVAEFSGVRFINDSKATNLSAMSAALRMSPGRVRLIAGGLVKEKDFGFVKELLAEKVLGVYLIGLATEAMASAWSDVVPCFRCGTLDVAVRRARADARAGETVLLSPATASFDQFRNFEERGQRFAQLVKDLAEEEAA